MLTRDLKRECASREARRHLHEILAIMEICERKIKSIEQIIES